MKTKNKALEEVREENQELSVLINTNRFKTIKNLEVKTQFLKFSIIFRIKSKNQNICQKNLSLI